MKSTMDIGEMRFAMVVVDMQRKFVAENPGLRDSTEKRLNCINETMDRFRSAGCPVILVFMDGVGHGLSQPIDNPDGLIDGLAVEGTDIRVHKTHMDGFLDKGLLEALEENGCNAVLLAGLVAQYCVMATYYGALDRGISPFILEGGVSATDEENVRLTEALCKTLSPDDLSRNITLSQKSM